MPQRLTILHLEDSQEDIELIQRELTRAGLPHHITVAKSGKDYVEALNGQRFDVILSDNQVLGLNGKTALGMARVLEAKAPFIFVTGQGSPEVRRQLLEAGADAIVSKADLKSLAGEILKAVKAKAPSTSS